MPHERPAVRSVRRPRRRLVARLLALPLVLLLTVVGALPAWAHDALISSNPANGAKLAAGPSSVSFVFSDVVQNLEPLITVVGANGSHWEGSPVTVSGTTVSVPVNPLGAAGTYTAAYRVISRDGHPVEGTVTFELTVAGTGTANATGAAVDAPSDSIPGWVWAVAAAAVLVVIAVVGLRSLRRRTDDAP